MQLIFTARLQRTEWFYLRNDIQKWPFGSLRNHFNTSYECVIFYNLACTIFFKNVHTIETHNFDLMFSISYMTAYVIIHSILKIILLGMKINVAICECVKVKECWMRIRVRVWVRVMIVTVNLHHYRQRKGAAFEMDRVQQVLLSTAESQPCTASPTWGYNQWHKSLKHPPLLPLFNVA